MQAEIDARSERVDSVKGFGQNLVKSGHSDSAEIKEALRKLEDAKTKLAQAWEDRKKTLDQALKLQVTYDNSRVFFFIEVLFILWGIMWSILRYWLAADIPGLCRPDWELDE